MSWTTTSADTVSWNALSPTAQTYTSYGHNVCPPAWAQVTSIQTEVDGGVDFRLSASSQFPMSACDDRPILAVEVIVEGRP